MRIRIISAVLAASWCLAPTAHAVDYSLKEITPAVQKALDARKERYPKLRGLKAQGIIGEDNQGQVKILKPSDEATPLVEAENTDRKVIYDAVIQQNGLGQDGLPAVQAAFAEVQREKSQPGDFIQQPSGEWTRK